MKKIVSGGQTGVDRSALRAGRRLGLQVGGWCPRGRRAEDGRIPASYRLTETPSDKYALRTEWNVRDSDATLIIHEGRVKGGTALTARLAKRKKRPVRLEDISGDFDPRDCRRWLSRVRPRVLNVAGPRESASPGIGTRAGRALREIFFVRGPVNRVRKPR